MPIDVARRHARARVYPWLYASIGGAWMLAHATGLLGGAAQYTFVLLVLSSIAATVAGARAFHPTHRWPFVVIMFGFVMFVAGGAARESLHTLGDLSASRSITPDILTLPGYVLLGLGLLGFAHARRGGFDFDSLLDAVLVALAALAFAWSYLITPALQHEHAPLKVQLVLVGYPAMSVFMVAIVMQIVTAGGKGRPLAQRLLLCALSMMVVGDAIYMFVEAHIWTVPVRLLDLPYGLAFLAFGTCVLHPSMRDLCEPVASTERAPTKGRLLLVSIALGLPLLVIVSKLPSQTGDRVALVSISIVLTAAAILRVFRSLRAHAASEERLTEQATHDSLTGLPNRFLVFERLNQALGHLQDTDDDIALLFVDVDRFKLVNDSYGHSLGDELLMAVAERLREETPPHSLIGRVGGDEFVVVIRTKDGLEGARLVAEHLRDRFTEPFEVRDIEVWSSASVGVALADRDEFTTAESLLRDADTAMYQAKEAGRDAVAIFDVEMRDRSLRRARLERDLHTALDNDEFVLHYQPVVSLDPIDVVGFEALLRWRHPHFGTVPPLEFITIAEDTGLIVSIGEWVLETACAQLAEWSTSLPGGRQMRMAVNMSARQLRDEGLVEAALAAATRNGVDAGSVCLELTESLLMDQTESARDTLRVMRDLGFRVSIDDFGTGYSSLAYLRTFQVDEVKIDKSFVDDLDHPDTPQESLVAAIVAMANALGVSTTAEGVETPRQAERLTALRVDAVQGYLYARPTEAAQVPGTVARVRQLRPAVRSTVTESV
jgi:diguanylate cyclase (GGDEF)-like protein